MPGSDVSALVSPSSLEHAYARMEPIPADLADSQPEPMLNNDPFLPASPEPGHLPLSNPLFLEEEDDEDCFATASPLDLILPPVGFPAEPCSPIDDSAEMTPAVPEEPNNHAETAPTLLQQAERDSAEEEEEVIVYSDSDTEPELVAKAPTKQQQQPLRGVKKTKKTRRAKKKANAWSSLKKQAEKEVAAAEAAAAEASVKLYQQQPFEDPELERCRLNALNAKLNRDRKKQEKNKLMSEMQSLRDENRRLKEQEEAMKSRAVQAEKMLARMTRMLQSQHRGDLVEKVTCVCSGSNSDQCLACSLDSEE